jgi:GNAT superfamily N-acetyltransferase
LQAVEGATGKMFTADEKSRIIIGEKLLIAAMDYARERGGQFFWCYSRVAAIGFYQKYGFKESGDVFDFPNAG